MRTNSKVLMSGLMLILLARAAVAAEPNVVQAARAERAPVIDGKLDDPAWEKAQPVSGFLINNTTTPATHGSSVRVVYDDDALYIAVRCEEPDVTSINTEKLPRDNGDVFRTDCVEIMLDPTHSSNDYFHFGVNAAGCVADRACTQGGFIGDFNWNAEIEAATFIGDKFWSCEVVIPFYTLGLNPKVKATWGFNVCREKKTPAEDSSIGQKGAFNIAGSFVELRGLDVDFSRFCYGIGSPTTTTQVRDQQLDIQVEVPVRNDTSQEKRVRLECWLISPTEQPHIQSSVVTLTANAEKKLPAGKFLLAEQGEYTCAVHIADEATKKPLAHRESKLPVQYVPVSVRLIEPWYRDAVFETQKLKQVVVEVELRLKPEELKQATLEVAIREAGQSKTITVKKLSGLKEKNRCTFDVAALPYGRLEVVATLKDTSQKTLANPTKPLRKLPYNKGEVWLGQDMQWRVDGKPFFLNGAWNYPEDFVPDYNAFTAEMPGVKLLAARPMNDLHYKIGARFREKSLNDADVEVCRSIARELKDAPDLLAYYLSDEPEGTSWSASALEQAYQAFRDEDPYHPVILSNDSMEGLRSYARCGEINGLHPYPPVFKDKRVNDLGPVAVFMEEAAGFFRNSDHKQTMAYLHQGFNYGDYGAVNNRIPSYIEYRNQDLLALICGANGFIQFNRMVAHYPELHIGMPHLTKEFAALGPVVLAPTSPLTVKASSDKAKTLLKDHSGHLWLLACNADNEPRELTLTVSGLGKRARRINILSEGRGVDLKGDSFTDHFDPWEVHVYTTSTDNASLLTVQEICRQIDAANEQRRKPGNLAFQKFEGDGVVVRASSNHAGQYRRLDNGLWHVVDGVVDRIDHYRCLTWEDTTPNAFPDWLEIELPEAHSIGRVVVYPFDKSLKDYAVQAFVEGDWKTVAEVKGQNDEELIHNVEPVKTNRIRLLVTATNGANAKVTEVEVYEK